jgi:hypothetical protein
MSTFIPTEIRKAIREYTPSGIVSLEELHSLCQELDPTFSITNLYFSYKSWLQEAIRLHNGTDGIYDIMPDSELTHKEQIQLIIDKAVMAESDSIDLEDTTRIDISEDSVLFPLLQHINMDPLDPFIYGSYDNIFYAYPSRKLDRITYEPFNNAHFEALKELVPDFTLGTIYEKLQDRVRRAKKPYAIDTFLNKHIDVITSIVYEGELFIDMKELFYNDPSLFQAVENPRGISVRIKGMTEDDYLNILAKLIHKYTFAPSTWYLKKQHTSFI